MGWGDMLGPLRNPYLWPCAINGTRSLANRLSPPIRPWSKLMPYNQGLAKHAPPPTNSKKITFYIETLRGVLICDSYDVMVW